MKDIKFVEVRSELGAGTRGSSLGVDAIKIAALDYRSDIFLKYSSLVVKDKNEVLFHSTGSPFGKRIVPISEVVNYIADSVESVVKSDAFPIVLTGDHSNAIGTLAGIRRAFPSDERIGVIWIDAHSDLHTPYTTPSGNVHGMPLAAALGLDNLDGKINTPADTTIEAWESLKKSGNTSPMIKPEDMIFVGLRDYEIQEMELIKSLGIRVISPEEIRLKGIEWTCAEILNTLKDCDHLHISFDVDSLDPTISRGTGTPVPGGLTQKDASNIILTIIQHEHVRCFEITEVNPTLDIENRMAESTFEILQKVVNQLEMK